MTKRSQLSSYIDSLKEIANIMMAMKNLSLIEINKVTKFLLTQARVVKSCEDVGCDFLHFFPQLLPEMDAIEAKVYILLGSERGFCGNFNESLVTELHAILQEERSSDIKLIIVGRKLATKFTNDPRVIQVINGPSATEEIPQVIAALVHFLTDISANKLVMQHIGQWNIIYNVQSGNKSQSKTLSPFTKLKQVEPSSSFTFAPLLYQTPQEFLANFLDQYIFAILYDVFYQSLMAENNLRLQHMQGAISRLEKQATELTHKLNLLKQEEITEEIEIILLNAEELIEDLHF